MQSYATAVAAGDAARVYALMSLAYKREHTQEDVARLLRDNQGDLRDAGARLRHGLELETSARMRYGDSGDELALVEENGSWKVVADPIDLYPQDTPSLALRSALRAIRLKRYDVLLRLVPKEYRERMTTRDLQRDFEGEHRAESEKALALLQSSLDLPIEQQGDAARLSFGAQYEVKFRREDDGRRWTIERLF